MDEIQRTGIDILEFEESFKGAEDKEKQFLEKKMDVNKKRMELIFQFVRETPDKEFQILKGSYETL